MSGRARTATKAQAPASAQREPSFQQQARGAELQNAIEKIRASAREELKEYDHELPRALRLVGDLGEKSVLDDVKKLATTYLNTPIPMHATYSTTHGEVLKNAAYALGCIGTAKSAGGILLELLKRNDYRWVKETTIALEKLNCRRTVEPLKNHLDAITHYYEELECVASALLEINTREALATLAEYCACKKVTFTGGGDSPNYESSPSERLARKFCKNPNGRKLARLVKACEDYLKDTHAQNYIEGVANLFGMFAVLCEHGGTKALVKAIDNPDGRVRNRAIYHLTKVERLPSSTKLLRKLYGLLVVHEGELAENADSIAKLMGKIKLQQSIERLSELSESGDVALREVAACGLSRAASWSEEAARKLGSLLEDEDVRVRVKAMGEIRELRLVGFEEKIVARITSRETFKGSERVTVTSEAHAAEWCIRDIGISHPKQVLGALVKAYSAAAELEHKKMFFEFIRRIHDSLLRSQKKASTTATETRWEKPWGFETFEVLSDKQGLTVLYMKPREEETCFGTSFHFHATKEVSIKVISGKAKIVYDHDKKEKTLERGDCAFNMKVAVPHQIINVGDTEAQVLEFEVPPCKEDICRLEDSHGRIGTGYTAI